MLERMRSRKPRVLVVDDDSLMVALVGSILQRSGFDVTQAMGVREGLELAKTGAPDVILLDLLLSGTDGLELLKQLRLLPETARTPVLLLTGVMDDMHDDQMESLQVAGYIVRPFAPAALVDKVMETCGFKERTATGTG
jgi:DNA-binding response OmpR family regulator